MNPTFDQSSVSHLSDDNHRPVSVSLCIVAQACRIYDKSTREACLWLANLAANSTRIQLCWQRRGLPDPLGTVGRIAEADLAARLGISKVEILRALTGHPEANLPLFREAVEKFRAYFESQLPPLVKTQDTKTVENAVAIAVEERSIVLLSGKWRHGKTEESERQWLKNLHRALWVHTPCSTSDRSFLHAFGSALGLSMRLDRRPETLREQIQRTLCPGLIELVFMDEGHNLWPTDLTKGKPIRAEFVRQCRDQFGAGFVIITTDQFALSLEIARNENTRWAPGQLFGRIVRCPVRDMHTPFEIRAIAKLHAGPIEDVALEGLTKFANADEGYLGAMVNVAKRARRAADAARGAGAEITAAEIAEATRLQQADERIVQMAATATATKRGKEKIRVVKTLNRRVA